MTSPTEGNKTKKEDLEFHFENFPKYFWAYLSDVLDLKKGVDSEATIADIKSKSSLAGANSWMLMCSIVIASIGLSQNSQAVIIGAMLISPLMSPVLGIGLSIGINDMLTLKDSLAQFAIAIAIAVLTSYVYFEFTPFNELTSEISARTKPTFLDIFIAIFGGIAGIISTARKDISTTLPGVAIATALMPPLCVTGYGLASGDWKIASASFYLFFLNTFFVALATYFIVRFLKFPYRQFIDRKTRNKNVIIVVAFSLALVIPSFLIFKNVLKELRLKNNLAEFKAACLEEGNRYLDDYTIDGNKLILRVYGEPISVDEEADYVACLRSYGINNYDLEIISTSEVSLDEVQLIDEKINLIASKMEGYENDKKIRDRELKYLKSNTIDSSSFYSIQDEIKILYPDIEELGLAKIHSTNFERIDYSFPSVLVRWKNQSRRSRISDNQKIEEFLKVRLELDTIRIINY